METIGKGIPSFTSLGPRGISNYREEASSSEIHPRQVIRSHSQESLRLNLSQPVAGKTYRFSVPYYGFYI